MGVTRKWTTTTTSHFRNLVVLHDEHAPHAKRANNQKNPFITMSTLTQTDRTARGPASTLYRNRIPTLRFPIVGQHDMNDNTSSGRLREQDGDLNCWACSSVRTKGAGALRQRCGIIGRNFCRWNGLAKIRMRVFSSCIVHGLVGFAGLLFYVSNPVSTCE